jgi:hypothetical protein
VEGGGSVDVGTEGRVGPGVDAMSDDEVVKSTPEA